MNESINDLRLASLGVNQYLNLVVNICDEVIACGNKHLLTIPEHFGDDDTKINKYIERNTKWSDYKLIVPLLFNFYHGLELIIKSIIVKYNIKNKKTHSLSLLLETVENIILDKEIVDILKKYIKNNKNTPKIIKSFLDINNTNIDKFYDFLKYPISTDGTKNYKYSELKYKGEKGINFYIELKNDIGKLKIYIVKLIRDN